MYFAPKIYPGFLFGANADAAFADSVHGDANDILVLILFSLLMIVKNWDNAEMLHCTLRHHPLLHGSSTTDLSWA